MNITCNILLLGRVGYIMSMLGPRLIPITFTYCKEHKAHSIYYSVYIFICFIIYIYNCIF